MIGAFISIFPNRLKCRRAESFEACCQSELLNVRIIALLCPFTIQKHIYPPVSKVQAGSFRVSVIHRTLTWTTGSLTCVRGYSYACVYTRGLGTPSASQHNVFGSEKINLDDVFLCSGHRRGSNLWSFGSLDIESKSRTRSRSPKRT